MENTMIVSTIPAPSPVQPPMTPMSFTDMERLAIAIAESGLFGMKTPAQALALMAISQAEGRHPALAAMDYHIIDGRPSLKADAMMARFQQSGGIVSWESYSDTEVTGVFSHPASPKPVKITWTMEKAKRAGLLDKRGSAYSRYPAPMLRSRCITEGIRTVNPGSTGMVYSPEEIQGIREEQEAQFVRQGQPLPDPVIPPPAPTPPTEAAPMEHAAKLLIGRIAAASREEMAELKLEISAVQGPDRPALVTAWKGRNRRLKAQAETPDMAEDRPDPAEITAEEEAFLMDIIYETATLADLDELWGDLVKEGKNNIKITTAYHHRLKSMAQSQPLPDAK